MMLRPTGSYGGILCLIHDTTLILHTAELCVLSGNLKNNEKKNVEFVRVTHNTKDVAVPSNRFDGGRRRSV